MDSEQFSGGRKFIEHNK